MIGQNCFVLLLSVAAIVLGSSPGYAYPSRNQSIEQSINNLDAYVFPPCETPTVVIL